MIEIQGLSKAYSGAQALSDVSLTLGAGEFHALVGENGAGKSTLIHCLSGATRPDGGAVRLDGVAVPTGDIRAAERAGIAVLHQESPAFGHLGAAENIFAGRERRRFGGMLVDRARMERETHALLVRLGERMDIRRPLEELSSAQRQMIGLARALSRRSRLLILDEPTAALSAREVQTLFRILSQLQGEGVAILYITHRLEEVFALASRVTVLRDGRLVGTYPVAQVSRDELVRRMVGRELGDENASQRQTACKIVLDVSGLTRTGHFQDISFSVRAGEIVGLAGLVGAGRSAVAETVFGMERPTRGKVTVAGAPLPPGSVRAAVARGLALIPEDRQRQGLALPMSVSANLLLAVAGSLCRVGFRARRREQVLADRLMDEFSIKAASLSAPVSALSGGNQQKVVLGKWLACAPRVLLLDEPTRGVDVGAKAEIYRLIRRLADQGTATLLISSDLPELLALSDRILVMREGRLVAELPRREADEATLLTLALPGGPS